MKLITKVAHAKINSFALHANDNKILIDTIIRILDSGKLYYREIRSSIYYAEDVVLLDLIIILIVSELSSCFI